MTDQGLALWWSVELLGHDDPTACGSPSCSASTACPQRPRTPTTITKRCRVTRTHFLEISSAEEDHVSSPGEQSCAGSSGRRRTGCGGVAVLWEGRTGVDRGRYRRRRCTTRRYRIQANIHPLLLAWTACRRPRPKSCHSRHVFYVTRPARSAMPVCLSLPVSR